MMIRSDRLIVRGLLLVLRTWAIVGGSLSLILMLLALFSVWNEGRSH